MNSIRGTSLNIKENNSGNLTFTSDTKYKCVSSSYDIRTNSTYTLNSTNNIKLNSDNGNIAVNVNNGELKLTSLGNLSNAIILEATHANGGILQTAGTEGINLNTIDGNIDLLSKGSNINIGVSPIGTVSANQTQNLNMECFNNYNLNSGDMYFVSSDIISFISQTGDIHFGTSSDGTPIIQFQNQNLLVNQSTSALDYQLDVAVTDESSDKLGYNGIVVNTKLSNIAADLTLQTSNTLGDRTQCILSMGSFGSNNNKAIFASYIAYQTNNVITRMDADTYNPKSLNVNNGKDFTINDIGKSIYWETTGRLDTITGLSSNVTTSSDTSNVTISGSYTGETSRVYLLQIDSLSTPNTFRWSNDGGNIYQKQLIPITLSPISLENGLSATFTQTTGFTYNQEFTFQTKITALVSNTTSISIPEPLHILQPYHSYINTTTPSDIVIKTNDKEKMRITADGSISINQHYPKATLDINSNYNKIMHVNETITGYQINPAITYLESGGYVLVWNSQHITGGSSHYDIIAQRYMADGSKYNNNFTVNTEENDTTQTVPSITGNKTQHSNHYLISWKSYNSTNSNYYVYSKIYHNNNSITTYDIENRISSNTIDNVNCAGLYNGNYIIVWAEDNGAGKYTIYGQIIDDSDGSIGAVLQLSPTTTYSRNFPFVAGLPSDDTYTPNGFVVGYMSALDSTSDPVYSISARVFNSSGTATTGEITITDNVNTNVSDGLVSVAEIKNNNVNGTNGGFLLSFYRSYQANTNLYAIGNPLTGSTSGTSSSILDLNYSAKQIILDDDNSVFLVGEEISIVSSVGSVGTVIEKINAITYASSNIVITLDTGSRSINTYRFNSNLSSSSDALWTKQVNTSPLYSDTERNTSSSSIFKYKKPLSYVSIDNQGTALVSWTTDSIPSIYYQLLSVEDGSFIGTEQKLTNEYDGLKQRNQVVTHLHSTQGNDYGFVIAWDNQSLDLNDTGIYQQLIGYKHNLLNLEDGNSNFIFTHYNQMGIGTTTPDSSLHIKTRLSNGTNSNNAIGDPPNTSTIHLQNTSTHVITNEDLQSIKFSDGSNNVLNKIQSVNSLRYDDLYPQPTNLKGFYKFDSSDGSQITDSSIFNHTRGGTKTNTNGILNNFNFETCWTTGIINNALLFDGNNNYVFIDNDANNELNTILENSPNEMSISMWINIPNDIVTGSTYDIISNGGNVSVAGTYIMGVSDIGSNGSMVLTSNIITHDPADAGIINNIGLYGSITLNDTNWHHIVQTVDITGGGSSTCTISLYVDGVLDNTITSSGRLTVVDHGPDKTYIGSRDGLGNYYRGYMDEMRIYNSILTTNEIEQLYTYGNPNSSAKGTLLITPTSNSTNNKVIVIDDNGRFNNLNSRPLPYKLLTGDIIATKDSKTITGTGTLFTSELNIGDTIILGENYDVERVVVSITNDTTLILDSRGFVGPEATETYKKVFKKPCIYSFFDNSDSHRGHIDNYGKLMIGNTNPSTLLEISGVDGSTTQAPEITMTNTSIDDGENKRKTSLNFRGYDTSDTSNANPFVNLGHIETSHYGTSADNKATMRFFINTGSGTTENSAMDITTDGISIYDSISLPITITTTALELNNTHHTVICNVTDSAIAITLPATTISGRIYILKKYPTPGSFALTINPNGNQIDGSGATYTVSSTSFIKLQSDGTNWWIIG